MTSMDRWVERHQRRMAFGLFLERAADWLVGFFFVFGTAVLVVKLLAPGLWPNVLWIALAVLPVSVAAWLLSRRNRYTRRESVAMLDRRLDAGGLLMTLSEAPDDQWSEQLPRMESIWSNSIPKVRPVRFAKNLWLPLLFALGSCFVPLREANTEPVLPNMVGKQASQELEELLALLEEADVLDEKEEEQLREEIEKLAEQTEDTPLTHEKWETVDALRERMQMRLDEAARTVEKGYEAALTLAKAAAGDGPELSSERRMELEQDVLDALRKLAKNGAFSGKSAALRDQLQRLAKTGEFKLPTDLQSMDELKEFLDQEAAKLAELRSKEGVP